MIAAVALFFFTDSVVPETTVRANTIWIEEVKKKSLMSSREKNIWIKGNRRITHITYYNPIKQKIYGVSVSFFDDRFRLIRKIDAEQGVFQDSAWLLTDLIEQTWDETTQSFQISHAESLMEPLDFEPVDLAKVVRKPEEMSFRELQRYIRKVEDEGYDATIHRVNLHAKPAYAFVCIIMCFMGMGLAVRKGIDRSIFFSIAYGIALAFFYWIVHSFCLSLGYGEMLPPLVAVWVANFIFMILSVLILIYAE
jgi:lipopolysaccharide export system permease protein